MLTVSVVRAIGGGKFETEYRARVDGNRVQVRLQIERMQDCFDAEGAPLRAYMCYDGVPIEAAYCLRDARVRLREPR